MDDIAKQKLELVRSHSRDEYYADEEEDDDAFLDYEDDAYESDELELMDKQIKPEPTSKTSLGE